MPKDLFSSQSDLYARYRPAYPASLFNYVVSFVNEKKLAWDCATGNGQAAAELAKHFKKVIATDISEAQIRNALAAENIEYHVCPAEKTPFADNQFDLVTVAQAYHWLNWKKFKLELTRVSKPGGVIAVWMYSKVTTGSEEINEAINHFYSNVVGDYWDKETKFVDKEYETIDFEYEHLPSREFSIEASWNQEDLLGYIASWSAVAKFIQKNGYSPMPFISKKMNEVWNSVEKLEVRFPLHLKLGRIKKKFA